MNRPEVVARVLPTRVRHIGRPGKRIYTNCVAGHDRRGNLNLPDTPRSDALEQVGLRWKLRRTALLDNRRRPSLCR